MPRDHPSPTTKKKKKRQDNPLAFAASEVSTTSSLESSMSSIPRVDLANANTKIAGKPKKKVKQEASENPNEEKDSTSSSLSSGVAKKKITAKKRKKTPVSLAHSGSPTAKKTPPTKEKAPLASQKAASSPPPEERRIERISSASNVVQGTATIRSGDTSPSPKPSLSKKIPNKKYAVNISSPPEVRGVKASKSMPVFGVVRVIGDLLKSNIVHNDSPKKTVSSRHRPKTARDSTKGRPDIKTIDAGEKSIRSSSASPVGRKITGRDKSATSSPKAPKRTALAKQSLQYNSPKSTKQSPVRLRPSIERAPSEHNSSSLTKRTIADQQPSVGEANNTAEDIPSEPQKRARRGKREAFSTSLVQNQIALLDPSPSIKRTKRAKTQPTSSTTSDLQVVESVQRPGTLIVSRSRCDSKKNLQSPEMNLGEATSSSGIKKPTIGRRLAPARTYSCDLEVFQSIQEPSLAKRAVKRSLSSDLELLAESSMQDRTDILPSILRSSTQRGPGILRNSSNRRGSGTRTRFERKVSSNDGVGHSIHDDMDAFVDGGSSFIECETIKFNDDSHRPPKPPLARPGLGPKGGRPGLPSKSKSLKNISGHFSMSTRSLMGTDGVINDFPDDKLWQKGLRSIRILPPVLDEKPEKKRIRQYIWICLCLDFIAAMVSVTTYRGVTTCCDVPIFSLTFIQFNWSQAIRIMTYIYIVMIFAEIIPVLRKGLPFNLLNPMVGFTITFAMFFDDRITEAICMWIIEGAAICFEFLVFRIHRKLFHDRYERLDKVQQDLNPYTSRRRLMSDSHHRRGRSLSRLSRLSRRSKPSTGSSHGSGHSDGRSDSDSLSSHSFGDEDDVEDPVQQQQLPSSSNHKLREARLLRERRMLREKQKADRTQLHYHLAGVLINLGLTCISLILIGVIASSGGLCVRSDGPIVIFDMHQLDRCSDCRGEIVDGLCEICSEDGHMQCFYQYI